MAGKIQGICIEFRGDTTGLNKALKEIRTETKVLSKELGQIDRALKFNPTNIDLWKQKQQVLNAEIDKTEQNIKELKAIQADMDKNGVDRNSAQYRELQREIIYNEQRLKEFKAQMRNMQSPQIEALKQKFSELGAKMEEVGGKIKAIGDGMANLGRTMTYKVTMPIVSGFAAAVKSTIDFDSQMTRVKALSGSTADEFDNLKGKAREMGEATVYTATEAGEAFEYMALAGWSAQEMMDGISGILDLAAAGMSDLGTTSDIVTDGLTAFHLEAKDAAHFADVLAVAMSRSNTTTEMLGEAFKYIGPVAGAAGYAIEDIAVALGLMANSGIKASQGGTTLRNVIQRMAAPTDAVANAMEALGLTLEDGQGGMKSFAEVMGDLRKSFKNIKRPTAEVLASIEALEEEFESGAITEAQYNKRLAELTGTLEGSEQAMRLQAASTIAGTRGMAGLLAIVTASEEEYEELTNAINNASEKWVKTTDGAIIPMTQALAEGKEIVEEYSGASAKMAAEMMNNTGGELKKLSSKIGELALNIGNILMPIVDKAVNTFQGWVDAFNALDESKKKTIVNILGIVAAIGPLLLIGGKLIGGIGTIMTKIGWLITKLPTIMTALGGLSPTILAIVGAVAALAAGAILIIKNWDKIKEKLGPLWEGLKEKAAQIFGPMAEDIKEAANKAGQGLSTAWEWTKEKLNVVWEGIKEGARQFGGILSKFWEEHGGQVAKAFSDIWDGIKMRLKVVWDAISAIAKAVFAQLQSFWQSWGGTIMAYFKTVWNWIKAVFETTLKVLSDLFAIFAAAFKGDWQGVWDNVQRLFVDVWNGIKKIFGTILEGIKNVATNAFEGIKNAIKNRLNFIADAVTAAVTLIGDKLGFKGLGDKVKSVFNSIKTFITDPINTAKDLVTSAVDKIKSIFPIKMGKIFSGIKLPHFKISGGKIPWGIGGAGEKPSVSIEWYAKGGIFRRPTIFANGSTFKGVGEAGAEAVLPLDLLWDNMQAMGGQIVQGVTASNDRMDALMAQMVALQMEMLAEIRRPKDFKVDGRWAGRYVADLMGG